MLFAAVMPLLTLIGCGDKSDDTATEASDASDALWADYVIEAPTAEITAQLTATPFLWPEQVCVDVEGLEVSEGTELSEDGELCVWDNFSGNVPDGMQFTDVLTCDISFTQGPPWFAPPSRVYESDIVLLDDPEYAADLEWVSDQVGASGCACCHDSSTSSGHTSGFDVSAPGVWTDSMTNSQLSMGAGMFPEHQLFGHYDASANHGFDRTETLFASTDPERMKAFFTAELERRDGSEEDLEEAQGQFDALFGRLFEDVYDCIDPYEGIVEGAVTWNGDGVRQIYILEEGADTPGFPPNLHLPQGTVWAIFAEAESAPMASGTVVPGVVPDGAVQAWPEDGSVPAMVEGQKYRLYTSPDVMIPREANCTFTWN
ncbi:MAG: hypothetical protein ACI8RZ_001936 [Myxococcota bacterium]|jgi:hypothetical protein